MTDDTVVSPGSEGTDASGRDAADIDERVLGEAVGRGFITQVQGREALEAARAEGQSLLDVLRNRGLVSEESARTLDDEVKEDFVPGYKIISKLGEGGMGMVYKALQKRLDREVALKVVMPRLAADAEYIRRFEREAKAVAKLNHPNIVAAYDFGESHGRVYLAMEYVEGVNLADSLWDNGIMGEDRAVTIAREICAGLAHAAASGITHRDIKPANILLANRAPGATAAGTQAGTKITDLGLARIGEAQGGTELTEAGTILGTPGYMAPEQALGDTVDLRADIYAVGATLYQMVTGQRPFEDTTPIAMITRQQTQPLDDPRDLVPGLSAELVALLQGMLAKDPSSRYADYKSLLQDIDRVRSGQPPAFPLPPRGHRSIAPSKDPVLAGEAPGGTVITPPPAGRSDPGHADTGTVALDRSDLTPQKSRTGLVLGICVVAAAAGAFLVATKPWKKESVPVDPGAEGTGREGKGDAGGAGAGPDAPADADDAEPIPDIGEVIQDEDLKQKMDLLAAQKRRYDALPAAKRAKGGVRASRLKLALGKAQKKAARRVLELWENRQYSEALSLATWVQERLGKKFAGREINLAVQQLGALEQKDVEDEARTLRLAEEAIGNGDAIAALNALSGFEGRYPFSRKGDWARDASDRAKRDAPEVTFKSKPTGATVYLGDRDVGTTPLVRRVQNGSVALRLELKGYETLERTLDIKRVLPQEHSLALTAVPPPDPDPAVELVRDGDPRPLWFGTSLGAWSSFKGSWAVSDPTRAAELEGKQRKEPAAALRGAGRTLSMARLDLAKFVQGAPGWKLEWMMIGARATTGSTARVEMHFCVCDDDTALVLGIDDQDAYLGRRDLSTGALERLRRWKGISAGERHTFAVEDHGDVFRIFIDGYQKGAINAPAARVKDRTIRVAVEDGVGFFSDIVRWLMKKP